MYCSSWRQRYPNKANNLFQEPNGNLCNHTELKFQSRLSVNISVSYFPRDQVWSGLLCSEWRSTNRAAWSWGRNFVQILAEIFFSCCSFAESNSNFFQQETRHLKKKKKFFFFSNLWWIQARHKWKNVRKSSPIWIWDLNGEICLKQPLRSVDSSAIIQCWHCRSRRQQSCGKVGEV